MKHSKKRKIFGERFVLFNELLNIIITIIHEVACRTSRPCLFSTLLYYTKYTLFFCFDFCTEILKQSGEIVIISKSFKVCFSYWYDWNIGSFQGALPLDHFNGAHGAMQEHQLQSSQHCYAALFVRTELHNLLTETVTAESTWNYICCEI